MSAELLKFWRSIYKNNYLYNNMLQIVQNEDYMMILVEMVHDARIIRIDQEHHGDGIKHWTGDSVGWYEGETLVVETAA